MNEIHPTALIGANVRLGKGNTIGPYCVIGHPGAIRNIMDFSGEVHIGDNNTIGCHVTIAAGADGITKVGSDNIIMNHANIGHNSTVGNGIEVGAGTIICGWAKVEDKVRIKAHCTIRNRKTIGEGSVIGMGANVIADVPPLTTVMGNPAK